MVGRRRSACGHGRRNTCAGSCGAGWPCDDQAAKLRDAFIKAPDRPAQIAAAEALQKRMWETVPFFPGGQYDQPYVWGKNITGVLPTGLLGSTVRDKV